MNVLYIADPNSIHDVRWINFFAQKDNIHCYVVFRKRHLNGFGSKGGGFCKCVKVLGSIEDPSTIRPWRNARQAWKIRNIIRKYDIGILHILYAEPNALWSNWKRIFKVAIVITTRGTDILQTIPRFFNRPSVLHRIIARNYRRAFEKADFITCTSTAQVESLRKLGISNHHAMVVRTGVDFTLLKHADNDVRATIGIAKPFVLMPRNMKPVYNHEFTIDAIRLLSQSVLEKYCFIFVNSDAEDQAYVNRILMAARTIPGNIIFVKSLTHAEIISLYKEAALIVMNPVSDGSPVSAMEALACGTPVILPPLEYDEEIFADAFFFEEWKPEALKTKMEEVLTFDCELLASRLMNGIQTIGRHGDSCKQMEKIEKMYHVALNGVQE